MSNKKGPFSPNQAQNNPIRPPEKSEVAIECFLMQSMNTLEANKLYFDTCLHTTVSSLEKCGLQFSRFSEKRINRQGRTTKYTRYSLLSSSRQRAIEIVREKQERRGLTAALVA